MTELKKDIASHLAQIPEEKRGSYPETKLAIFSVHNKLKEKAASLPEDVMYFAGEDVRACHPPQLHTSGPLTDNNARLSTLRAG